MFKKIHIKNRINEFNENVDVVVENPPFGTKDAHADKVFLEKAFSLSDCVYSFHKTSTAKFVAAAADDNGFNVSENINFSFPLKAVHEFHRRQIHRIEVTLFRLERKK